MSDQELLFALQCCAPNHKVERDCASCPLRDNYMCHTELLEAAMNSIVANRSRVERLNDAISHAESVVASLRTCC